MIKKLKKYVFLAFFFPNIIYSNTPENIIDEFGENLGQLIAVSVYFDELSKKCIQLKNKKLSYQIVVDTLKKDFNINYNHLIIRLAYKEKKRAENQNIINDAFRNILSEEKDYTCGYLAGILACQAKEIENLFEMSKKKLRNCKICMDEFYKN